MKAGKGTEQLMLCMRRYLVLYANSTPEGGHKISYYRTLYTEAYDETSPRPRSQTPDISALG